jgi:hypothetical protein
MPQCVIQGAWSRWPHEVRPNRLLSYEDGVLVSATEGTASAVWTYSGMSLSP